MVEKLVVDEDANATSQQSIFKIGTKKIIVQGDIMDSGPALITYNKIFQNIR